MNPEEDDAVWLQNAVLLISTSGIRMRCMRAYSWRCHPWSEHLWGPYTLVHSEGCKTLAGIYAAVTHILSAPLNAERDVLLQIKLEVF